tara:strand:- start:1808 stop:2281 length:474 start_codon:yes stop_codon:yes gene_type:complete
MGLLVNKKQLAEILEVTERTLTDWQKNPSFPIEVVGQRGQPNQYDTGKVIRFMIERSMAGQSQESQRERRDRLEGDRLELDIAQRCDTLVVAEEYEKALTSLVFGLRNSILQGDSTLKMQLDSLYGIDIDIDVINEHSRSLLQQLASYEQDTAGADH